MEGPRKVLLIGIERKPLQIIAEALEKEGFETRIAVTQKEAIREFWEWKPDLTVLDITASNETLNGWTLIPKFKDFSPAPIITLVSPQQDSREKILALRQGADDSVSREASVREITARVKAQLRRTSEPGAGSPSPHFYTDGNLLIDFNSYELYLDGRPVKLTAKEFAVLACLARHPRQVMTPRQIAWLAWAEPASNEKKEKMVRQYIYRLRRKLEPDPSSPIRIKSAKGLGYYLDDPRRPLILPL